MIYDLETGEIIFEDERVTGMERIFDNPNNEIRFSFTNLSTRISTLLWINPEKCTISFHEDERGKPMRMNIKQEKF